MMPLIDCGNGVRLERGVACRLSDGVTLVSDHYYPAGEGPWPTLLMRQPYGRDIASTVVYAHPVWFARHGYHVVIQDVRGRGGSSGEFYPFRHEGRDGAETIAWLRAHPACNGRIGMYGFSYQGATQLLAAAEQPEGLQCIAPHMTAADLYHGWFYHQGALRLSSALGWGIQMLREDARRRGLREASDKLGSRVGQHSRAGRARSVCGASGNRRSRFARLCARLVCASRARRVLDRAGHQHAHRSHIRVPALHIAGWFDTYLEGSIAGYLALRKGAGTRVCARESISDCRPVGAHSLGRSRRRCELRRGCKSQHRRDPAPLVQSLAEGYLRILDRSRASAIFAWAPTTGAARTTGMRRRIHALSAQCGQCQFAQGRRPSLS